MPRVALQPYRNLSGKSGVVAYRSEPDAIIIRFRNGETLRYDGTCPGKHMVAAMQRLADEGRGLSSYISRHVGKRYAQRLEPGEPDPRHGRRMLLAQRRRGPRPTSGEHLGGPPGSAPRGGDDGRAGPGARRQSLRASRPPPPASGPGHEAAAELSPAPGKTPP